MPSFSKILNHFFAHPIRLSRNPVNGAVIEGFKPIVLKDFLALDIPPRLHFCIRFCRRRAYPCFIHLGHGKELGGTFDWTGRIERFLSDAMVQPRAKKRPVRRWSNAVSRFADKIEAYSGGIPNGAKACEAGSGSFATLAVIRRASSRVTIRIN
jgi:hypothetical protein